MRQVIRTKAGAIVASVVVATAAGSGIWYSSVGGFAFGSSQVTLTSSCTSTCSGTVTLTAAAPSNAVSVEFDLNGAALGVDSTSPFTWSLDTTVLTDGTYSLTAKGTGPGSVTATSSAVSVATSNTVTFTANVFVAPDGTTGGTTSCSASASPIDYATALSSSHVCVGDGTNFTGLDKACLATKTLSAAGGATVGVKAGSYTSLASGAVLGEASLNGEDCSGGKGGNYNPNADISKAGDAQAGSTTGWVTFSCADGNAGTVSEDAFKGAIFRASNFHAKIVGGCFRFNSPLMIGNGGDSTNVRNLWFEGTSKAAPLYVWSYLVKGGTNIYFKYISNGPSYLCGKASDQNVPAAVRCNASGQWWESHFAQFGPTSSSCGTSVYQIACGGSFSAMCQTLGSSENYVNDGDTASPIVRFDHLYTHDQQSPVDTNKTCVHAGGLLMQDQKNYTANSVVFDDWTCERVGVFCAEIHSGGVTIQNSTFTAPISQGSPSTTWAPAVDQTTMNFGNGSGGLQKDVLLRHNNCMIFTTGSCFAFTTNCGASCTNTYSNVRVIGNIIGRNSWCSSLVTGVSYDSDEFVSSSGYSGGCATNATTNFTDPWTDSAMGTSLPAIGSVFTSQLDATLTRSVASVANNGSPNSDYSLDHDAAGAARGGTTSNVGSIGP